MAKNVTCEVLTTIKGLDPKNPKGYHHAGTADEPTLIDLPGNTFTRDLIAAGAVRLYPGPQPAAQPSENEKIKALQAELAEAEKSLADAAESARKLTDALLLVVEATDIEAAVAIAREATA